MEQLDKWQKELKQLSDFSEDATNKKLFKYYRKALIDIKKEMKVFMDNYETLSFSKRIEAERLLEIGKQIDAILRETYNQSNTAIVEHIQDEVEIGYYGTWYAMEGAHNIQLDMYMLPEEYIKQLVHHPVNGKVFSKRLYNHTNKLAKQVNTALLDAARKGEGYAVAAKNISELTEASYKRALRIARTEGGRVQSTAKQRSYVEAKKKGVDLKKKWLSTLDTKTRHTHQALDGQVVEIEEKFISSNGHKADGPRLFGVASEDIHCRCTTITIVNGISPELRRDNMEKETFPYKNFKEWKKDRVDRIGQERWDIDEKKAKNSSKDKKLLENYRSVLGNKVPKSLDAFQELKYNGGEKWNQIQDNYFVKSRLKDGRYGSIINPDKQSPHMESTKVDGKSYFYDNVDVQQLFNKYAGTGEVDTGRNGRRNNKEIVIVDQIIGVAVSKQGTVSTNKIKIHHSKNRTHVVPIRNT